MIHCNITRRSSRIQHHSSDDLLLRTKTEKYIAHCRKIRSRRCDIIVLSTERFPKDLNVKPVGESVDGVIDFVGVFGHDGCKDGEKDGDAQGGDEGGDDAAAGDIGFGCYPGLGGAIEDGAERTHRSTIHDVSLSERCDDSNQEQS